MEDPVRLIRVSSVRALGVLGLVGALWSSHPVLPAVAADNPVGEAAEAVRSLGPPGFLWGRLAVEEESPDGAWTPLSGVEVRIYPAVPGVLSELERIRQSARGSGADYESAVARLETVLGAYEARVRVASGEARSEASAALARMAEGNPVPAAEVEAKEKEVAKEKGEARVGQKPGGPKVTDRGEGSSEDKTRKKPPDKGVEPGGAKREEAPKPPHRATDPDGLFTFDGIPSGDWLLVAIRVSPYVSKGQPQPRGAAARAQRFVATPQTPLKEAEIWLTRVRVGAGERVSVILTDRARWMVGPVR